MKEWCVQEVLGVSKRLVQRCIVEGETWAGLDLKGPRMLC